MPPWLVQLLTLLRVVAFMVVIYLALGLAAARWANPGGKVLAFFRTVCSPVTGPVSRMLAPGAAEQRVLVVSIGVVACVWVALIVLSELASP